jgi:GDP-L-fucose synthase
MPSPEPSASGFYAGKNVLVTGGTGFVGMHLANLLLEQGARVRIPIHIRSPKFSHTGIELVKADLEDPRACAKVCEGIDFVFHAAGSVTGAGGAGNNPIAAIRTNLVLTANIMAAASEAGVHRLQLFSSSAAYPPADHPVCEEEFWSGEPHPSYFGYGWMRRYIERLAEYLHRQGSVKVAVVRPTAIYGRHDDFSPLTSHVIPALIRKAVERMQPFEIWGTGDETRDFLHVEDLARGCLLTLERHAVCDPVNIGYGQIVTIRDAVKIILEAAGYEDADLRFDPTKPTTIPHRSVDTTKARELLGFQPRYSLQDGLADTIQWYRAALTRTAE